MFALTTILRLLILFSAVFFFNQENKYWSYKNLNKDIKYKADSLITVMIDEKAFPRNNRDDNRGLDSDGQ